MSLHHSITLATGWNTFEVDDIASMFDCRPDEHARIIEIQRQSQGDLMALFDDHRTALHINPTFDSPDDISSTKYNGLYFIEGVIGQFDRINRPVRSRLQIWVAVGQNVMISFDRRNGPLDWSRLNNSLLGRWVQLNRPTRPVGSPFYQLTGRWVHSNPEQGIGSEDDAAPA